MGTLSGPEIKRQMGLGNIVIDPPPPKINPNSANLTLGPVLKVYEAHLKYRKWVAAAVGMRTADNYPMSSALTHFPGVVERDNVALPASTVLDPKADNPTVDIPIPEEGLVLIPGVLYLASTAEYTVTKGFVPRIDGRSSIARLGLWVHTAAGYGDVGFAGKWTLELVAVAPVRVYAGMQIAQISYMTCDGEREEYAGRYQNSNEPVASRLHLG